MIKQGIPASEVASQCGISRSEAELIISSTETIPPHDSIPAHHRYYRTLAPQTVSSVRLLLEGGRALLDASVVPAKLPPLMLGEQVSAQVVDSKDNGQQLSVLIKNSLFNLIVPQGMTVSGNNLSLKVATLAPTLSFALQEQATEAAQMARLKYSSARHPNTSPACCRPASPAATLI
jgi:hypothetical protein